MTVVAFADPHADSPHSTRVAWTDFLCESLEADWRASEWYPVTLTFIGSLGSPTTDISTCLRLGCRLECLTRSGRAEPEPPHASAWCGCTPVSGRSCCSACMTANGTSSRFDYSRCGAWSRSGGDGSILPLTGTFSGLQRSLLRSVQQAVRRIQTLYAGDGVTGGDLWDCALVGLGADRAVVHAGDVARWVLVNLDEQNTSYECIA